MTWKMPISDIKSFLEIAVASRLVEEDDLSSAVQNFRRSHAAFDSSKAELDAFARYLSRNSTLTSWQCEKLKKGKHRGFLIDSYVILEHVEVRESTSVYRARDQETGATVLLEISYQQETNAQRKMEVKVISN